MEFQDYLNASRVAGEASDLYWRIVTTHNICHSPLASSRRLIDAANAYSISLALLVKRIDSLPISVDWQARRQRTVDYQTMLAQGMEELGIRAEMRGAAAPNATLHFSLKEA